MITKLSYTLLLLVMLFGCKNESKPLQAEAIRNKINAVAYSEYPLRSETDTLSGFDADLFLTPEEIPEVSFHTYADLGLKQRIRFEGQNQARLYRRLRPTKGKFDILLLNIGWENAKKTELVTWSPQQGVIDTLEAEVFFSPETDFYPHPLYRKDAQIKEFCITEDGQVVVTQIKILGKDVVYPFRYETAQVQWTQNIYKIDKNGKIHFLEQKTENPKQLMTGALKWRKNRCPLSENKSLIYKPE